jgi:serine/threonine protein kinase
MDMCDGLLHCHSGCGFGPTAVLLHRDVKPSNVLLYRDRVTGRLVGALGDFGVSKLYPAGLGAVAATATIYGTAGYIAPELTEGGRPSPQSDAYAAGVTIVQVGASYWR